MDEREQRAAMVRRLDRLTATLREVTQQRNRLAQRLASVKGTDWADELEAVGVEPHTARDPGPSEVVPLDSLPSFAERLIEDDDGRVRRGPFRGQFEAESRTRWPEADDDF